MKFQIVSFHKTFPQTQRRYPEKVFNEQDAKELLEKFRNIQLQVGDEVSEIHNNFFTSINKLTNTETIFQIESL